MELFAEHGVGATSYQMIADAVGVTKGAIYHQFNTKDEIVVAVAEMELASLEEALEAAEVEDVKRRGGLVPGFALTLRQHRGACEHATNRNQRAAAPNPS